MGTGGRLDLLYLSKIGMIPIRMRRPVECRVKRIIIKRYNSGEWFACVCVEEETKVEKEAEVVGSEPERVVGIDVGIRHFLTGSEGRQIENPRFYERTLERIRVLRRNLSRKRLGSRNREKARLKLARAYERLVNQRGGFLHKPSRL